MLNLLKAILLTTLMGPTFMVCAMDDSAIAKEWGMSVEEYQRQWALQFEYEGFSDFSNEPLKLTIGQTDTDNDSIIAMLISEEGYGNFSDGSYRINPLNKYLIKEDRNKYDAIVEAGKQIKPDTNVHDITANFARPYYDTLKLLEAEYIAILSKSPALSLADIEKMIEGLYDRNDEIKKLKQPIDELFQKIRVYWTNPVDGETTLDLTTVMSDTFNLANRYGDAALENLCITLADNIQTNGGCHPGVTGRLTHMFFIYVSAALEWC